jgi:hypothetical protein
MTPRDAQAPSLRWRRSPTGRAVLRRIRRAVARRNRPLVGWPAIAAWMGGPPSTVQAWHHACPMPLAPTPDGPTTTGPALDAYFFGPFAAWVQAPALPEPRRARRRPPLS